MSAEPSASIWEVTRLILESPERSPSEIAQEHGYSAAEVAELMPIFLDTARTDWSRLADDANGWATPAGLDAGSQDAELYLRDLAGSRSIEVAGFDTASDAPDLDLEDVAAPDTAAMGEPLPPDLGELLDDLAGGELIDQDGRDSLDGSDLDDPEDVDGGRPRPGASRRTHRRSARGGGPAHPDPADLVPSQTAAEITPALATPDDGLELGDDDPFDGNSSDDFAADDLTADDLPDEPRPADVEADDAGDPFIG